MEPRVSEHQGFKYRMRMQSCSPGGLCRALSAPGGHVCRGSPPAWSCNAFTPFIHKTPLLTQHVQCTALATALQRLTRDLADRGVQLLVTSGSWQEVIPDLAAAADVRRVLAEDEVESGARARVQAVAARLPAGTQLHTWTAPLRAGYSDTHAGKKGCHHVS